MKKKRFLFGIIFMIGLLLFGNSFYHENKVITQKKDVKEDYYEGETPGFYTNNFFQLYKTDEQGVPMDVTMRLVSPNEDIKFPLSNHSQAVLATAGSYHTDYEDFELSANEIREFFSNEQIEALESIHSANDLESVLGTDNYNCYDAEVVHNGNDNYYYPAECYTMFPTVYRVEETEVPDGYSKKKIYVPGVIEINFRFPEIEYNGAITPDARIEISRIEVNPLMNGYFIEYGQVEKEELQGIDPSQTLRLWKRYGEKQLCENVSEVLQGPNQATIARQTKENGSEIKAFYRNNNCPIELVNEKGELKLDISLSVNDKVTVTSDIEQELEFKVAVKNIGTLDAYDNTVRAKLPEGFKYVEGSASDDGTYQDGFITWTVDMLKEGNNVNLTYKAYAPKGININDNFIGEAFVMNDSIEGNYVEANKTYVKLSLNNPKTYNTIGIIVLVLLLSGLGLGKVLKKQQ